MIRLPVSGSVVELRLPDGADDIALIEGDPDPIPAALRLLSRIATPPGGAAADWSQLSVTDFEILLLHARRMLIGGTVATDVACPACRERVDISFAVADYIAAVRPATPCGVAQGPRAGWLALDGTPFRLPVVADLLAVRETPAPGPALRALCQEPATEPRARARIGRAIARMAPEVTGHVGGTCPACGAAIAALFDVPGFVVTELRRRAVEVYAELHLIAAAYGWDEAAILALPAARRRRYAELVRNSADAGAASRDTRYLAVA
jgi:hypothetical protein